MQLKKRIQTIIYTPNIYVSLVFATLIGGAFGVLVGLVSGGFIGYELNLCHECPTSVFGYDISFINLNAVAGAVLGAVVGAAFGGSVTGLVTTIHIYRKESLPKTLSKENIKTVLKSTLWISLELSIGLLIGGIIGSLKIPGLGTAIGAVTGIVLMLVATTLESNYRK